MVLDARRLTYSLYVEWADSIGKYYDACFDELVKRYTSATTILQAGQRDIHMILATYKMQMKVPLTFDSIDNRRRRLEASRHTSSQLQFTIRSALRATQHGKPNRSVEARCEKICAATAQHFAVVEELADRWLALLMDVQRTMAAARLLPECQPST